MINNCKYDIICIGTAILDSIIKGFDPNPVSAAGYVADQCTLNPGGEAVNEAVAAAKLGLKAGILCHLGKDAAGEILLNTLENNGVDTGLIVISEEYATPITTMFVNEDGTRKSITNKAHRYNFHPENCTSCFAETKAITLASLFRAPFNDAQIVDAVVRAANAQNVLIFADTKLPNFDPISLEDLKLCLPLIDYITPNEDEARFYTGREEPEEMADVFLSYGVKNVIIKLGAKGCFFKNKERTITLPAYAINAVDATGAGDCFLAGFASEVLRGSSIEDALRFANACGAICTTMPGANNALRNREQVLLFI